MSAGANARKGTGDRSAMAVSSSAYVSQPSAGISTAASRGAATADASSMAIMKCTRVAIMLSILRLPHSTHRSDCGAGSHTGLAWSLM